MTSRPPEDAAPSAYDVFNGDADGICALHQLRLAAPREAQLVTGVKREIDLLQRVPSRPGADVLVLDVSLDVNFPALTRLLDAGAQVTWFDHHSARRAFDHPALDLIWDDSPDVCTSLLVDRALAGRFRRWAIAAAFGDNLDSSARGLAARSGIDEHDTLALAELGRVLNYNAYGETVDDLHVAPDALYRELHRYTEPSDFIAESPCYRLLSDGYRDDMARIAALKPHRTWERGGIYVLPDACWARRISGVFANTLAAGQRGNSFAVLSANTDGSHVVSVRSGEPDERPANTLCERFEGGGGRRLAAGINRLPESELDTFLTAFSAYFGMAGTPRRH